MTRLDSDLISRKALLEAIKSLSFPIENYHNVLVIYTHDMADYITNAPTVEKCEPVEWAENLILQLPITHDGRNSWLLNHGEKTQAKFLQNNREKLLRLSGKEHTDYLTKALQSIADKEPSYTSPQQREWVGLSENDILDAWRTAKGGGFQDYAESLEAKLKQLNTKG